jgi:hypothetical protein
MQQAMEYSGITEKTELLHLGLKAIIQRYAAKRLAALGGTDTHASVAPRRRAL